MGAPPPRRRLAAIIACVGSPARDTSATAAAIVARIPQQQAARELAAELEGHVAVLEHASADSHADILNGLQRSLSRWRRFLSTGVMPPDADFDPLRAWTRARAAEGVRLEELLRSLGLVRQLGWRQLRRHARAEESEALLELAGLLAQYVDQVSAVVTETYLAERELLVSEEERRTHALLDRLCVDSPLDAADGELAERLGVPVLPGYVPFAVVAQGRPPHRHAALAARLRRRGWRLAVTHSECVLGLTWTDLTLADLGEGAQLLLAIGGHTPRAELRAALGDVATLAEHGRRAGLLGRLDVEEHLLEILLGSSPRLTGRLAAKVLAPLREHDHAELARTLETLFECRFDRTATSAALHVHRNTLAYRVGRIEEITGLDLASPRDRACVYVAMAIAPMGDGADPP